MSTANTIKPGKGWPCQCRLCKPHTSSCHARCATKGSCGVALLFKASPLLSNISLASIDPHGRFVAAQCNLCGGQVTLASVYAPVERQERAPFFLQCLVPALPARTPLVLGGDWNCVAGDQDLVGGQTGTRQHGFHSGLLPLQQALGLQDAFRHLHPDATWVGKTLLATEGGWWSPLGQRLQHHACQQPTCFQQSSAKLQGSPSQRLDHYAGRVLPTRGGPAAEAVANGRDSQASCGLIPVTCCMLWCKNAQTPMIGG